MVVTNLTTDESIKRFDELIVIVMAQGGFKKRDSFEYYNSALESLRVFCEAKDQ